MNTLVVIGWLSIRRCYLNVPREEAIKRYIIQEDDSSINEQYLVDNNLIREFTFEDEFEAYDAWAIYKP